MTTNKSMPFDEEIGWKTLILTLITYLILGVLFLAGIYWIIKYLFSLDLLPSLPDLFSLRVSSTLGIASILYLVLVFSITDYRLRRVCILFFGAFFWGATSSFVIGESFNYYEKLNGVFTFLFILNSLFCGVVGGILLVLLLFFPFMASLGFTWRNRINDVSNNIKKLKSFYKKDDDDLNNLFKEIDTNISSLSLDDSNNFIFLLLSFFNPIASALYIYMWINL